MNKQTTSGFSLVEVLVALLLAGVIVTISLLILHTTTQVANEVQQPIGSSWENLRGIVQGDLDHLLPKVLIDEEEPMSLSDEEDLTLISLRKDPNGIPHPYVIRYHMEASTLYRIREGGIPQITTTNILAESVRKFQPKAYTEGEEFTSWPSEETDILPQRLALEITTFDPVSERTLSFDIPASHRIESEK